MRAYFFGNMYLSSIQQGIQAGHVIGEMAVQYDKDGDFGTWAEFHKTMILLNGGYASNLESIAEHFSSSDNPFEWGVFRESEEALNSAITSVGIILPENIYSNASYLRTGGAMALNSIPNWEIKLYDILNSCRLAN